MDGGGRTYKGRIECEDGGASLTWCLMDGGGRMHAYTNLHVPSLRMIPYLYCKVRSGHWNLFTSTWQQQYWVYTSDAR
ncbi:hypothetical protein PISMIDRAFT_290178 [Pisolithus microcarpus 441]|uniref:Uncharacterized protein n=1 Tax=Pisolithus microcarpus 441 TaxID=765257 RepID=A0A0C9Z756_9AGAM|nr:hypothetical protein PISMIDRAFT_290178 [Pisolithus microcarpus 441]